MPNLFDDFLKGSAPSTAAPAAPPASATSVPAKPTKAAAPGGNLFDSYFEKNPPAAAPPAERPATTMSVHPDEVAFPGVFEKARKFLADMAAKFQQDQQAQAAAQQQAQQEAAARAQDPNFMSSTQFKKTVPAPQTIEEQAIYDATMAKKKVEEKQIAKALFPESVTKETPGATKLPSGDYGLKLDPGTGQPDQRPQIGPPTPGARPATPEENEQFSKDRTIRMIKEMPGDFDGAEAFFHGIVPYEPQGKDRMEAVDAAHPVAKAAGTLLGYAAAGVLTGGVAPAVEQAGFIQALPAFTKHIAGRIAATGSQFTLKSLTDSLAEQASGFDRSFGDISKKALKDAAFGLGLGAVGSIPSPVLRIPFEAGYGFLTAKLQGADNFEAGLNAGLFAALGMFNRQNLAKEFRKATVFGFKSATRDYMMEKGVPEEKAAKFAAQYYDKILERSINEEKPLTEDFIKELTKRVLKATDEQRAFNAGVRVYDAEPVVPKQIPGPAGAVAPEPLKKAPDEAKPAQASPLPKDRAKTAKPARPAAQEQPKAKKPARRATPPDIEKAIDAGDEASVIKAMGKFSFPSHLKGEIGKGQQYRKNMGKLFPFLRKDAQGLDELLQELKSLAPHLFNKYDTDADLLKAILDDKLKARPRDEHPEEKFQRDYERYIEEVLQRERQERELQDEARSLGIEEEEIRAAQRSAQEDFEAEAKAEGSRHDLSQLSQEGVEVHDAFPAPAAKPTELPEERINEIIARAGADYIGRQPGYKKRSGEMTEGLIMFNSPSGTTLALKPSQFSAEAVRAKLEESAAKESEAAKENAAAPAAVDTREVKKEPPAQAIIPEADKQTFKKAEFGEGRTLPAQQEGATDLQQKANDYKQTRLFEGPQDYGTLFPEEDLAYGGKKEKEEATLRVSSKERDVKVESPSEATPIWESPFALILKETGKLSFPKKKISGPADIAFAFQSLKNEVQEHFYLGAVKNNQVVGVELVHVGAIDESLVSIYEMIALMQAHQADGFFMVHNHPSGRIEPSPEDINITNKATSALEKLGIEFKGHVIINDSKFGFIHPNGAVDQIQHEEYGRTKDISLFKKYSEWKQSKDARTRVSGPETVYEILKGIQKDPEKAIAFFLDKGNRIQNLMLLPPAAVNVDTLARLAGASRATALILAGAEMSAKALSSLQQGLRDFQIRILDSITQNEKGNYLSARESTILDEPESEPYGVRDAIDEYAKKLRNPSEAKRSAEEYQRQDDFFDPPADEKAPAISYADPDMMQDISGFKSGAMDAFRIFQEVFGKNYPVVVDRLLFPFTEANGARVDMMEKILDDLHRTIVKKYGIKKGSKESEAVQRFGEGEDGWQQHDLKRMFPDKWENIIAADTWFRRQYDSLLDQVNSVLARVYPGQTQKQIPRRKSYYRHFREFSSLGGLKSIFDTPANISSRLAGLSEFTKPKSKFLSFAQRRLGLGTEVDAVGGFLDYLPAAAYAKHITPFIKDFRNLANFLRKTTEGKNHLNNFITYLDDYAGSLAGKTNPLDRLVVKYLPGGRKTMRLLNWINSRVKANVILGNVSSMMAQVFNAPQGIAAAKQYIFPGFIDQVQAIFDPAHPVNDSSFIKARYAEKLFDKFDVGMLSNLKDFANFMMSAPDEVATRFLWHSFYQKAIAMKHRNPMQFADYMTRKMVAGRSVGEVPLIQQSKLTQLLAPFQIEVGNLWWALRDTVKEKDFTGIVIFLITSYYLNEVAEKVRGNRVSFDLINAVKDAATGDKTAAERIGRIAGEFLSNIPAGQNLMSFYPEYGMKLPNGERLPTREKFFGKEQTVRVGSGLLSIGGLMDPLTKLLLPFGGQQVKRTREGVEAFRAGGYMRGKKWIQFDRTPTNFIKATLFGQYSIPDKNADELAKLKDAGEAAARRDRRHKDELRTYVQNAVANGASRQSVLKGPYKTFQDRKAIVDMFRAEKKKQSAQTPIERTLLGANSNAEKIGILRSVEGDYKTMKEFNSFLSSLGRKKIINAKVANDARKSFKERVK